MDEETSNVKCQTKPEIRGASLLNCVLLVSRCSDGVWDPEKWHASLYPTSERSSPVDGFKKDFADDRVPLKRRIPGKRRRNHDNYLISNKLLFVFI